MFSKTSKAERTAADAWDYLSSAMASLGETAKDTANAAASRAGDLAGQASSTSQDLAGRASDYSDRLSRRAGELSRKADKSSTKLRKQAKKANKKAGKRGHEFAGRAQGAAGEAWTRANAAADALAGNKPRRPWGLIAGIGLVGIAVGWMAAAAARAKLEQQAEEDELARADNAVVITPTGEV